MKIAILGFGGEGKSVLKFIKRLPEHKNAEIWILDANSEIKIPAGLKTRLGPGYLDNLNEFDLIFRSPGIPYMAPKLVSARKSGVKFSSATKLFFEKCPCPIIGIAGTKGKGTTSTLIYKLLKAGGRDVYLAGNIGLPAVDILPKLHKNSLVILELSSFQLQDLEKSPNIAVVLEIFPDHQEDIKTAKYGTHRSLSEYYKSKANIAKHQSKADSVFFFADKKQSKKNRFNRPG